MNKIRLFLFALILFTANIFGQNVFTNGWKLSGSTLSPINSSWTLSVGAATFAGSVTANGFTIGTTNSNGSLIKNADYGSVLRGFAGTISDFLITRGDGTIVFSNAVGTNNVSFTGNATFAGTVATTRVEEQEPDHAFFSYSNNTGTAISIATQNVAVQIGGSALLTDNESDGFTIDAQDTVTYTGTNNAHILFDVKISAAGGTNEDYELELFNVTDNAVVPTTQLFSTTGAANRASVSMSAYDVNANTNDEYVIRIKNDTNTNDPTIYRVMWFIKVTHY